MNKYIGNPLQLYGVEEVRLVGGKGDGMRLLNVWNGKGLMFTISLDRCGDISRLSLKGDNFSYFSPCGYVSPKYYDSKGTGFLKSFTAGFFTTCGLTSIGRACDEHGEELPMHGTISNTPSENAFHYIENDEIHIRLTVRDAILFSHKLLLEREYICPLYENVIYMTDKIKNIGSEDCRLEMMYHCNLGYPLLSENAVVTIPSVSVTGYNEHAQNDIENCLVMEKPQKDYEEKCYFHTLTGRTCVSVKNPDIQKGLSIKYDTAELGCLTEWKMMGEYDYVLGLEPGNSYPGAREKGLQELLRPDEEKTHRITFEFTED